jgi:hypothetical protein
MINNYFQFKLNDDLKQALKQAALDLNVSSGEYVRRLLKQSLEKEKKGL